MRKSTVQVEFRISRAPVVLLDRIRFSESSGIDGNVPLLLKQPKFVLAVVKRRLMTTVTDTCGYFQLPSPSGACC